MPELPEVETIKRQLNKEIKGKTIKKVKVRLKKILKSSLSEFRDRVEGAKISNISRRAKLIIFELSNGWFLITHLKLTGQLILNGQPNKHTHLIYYFTDGSHLIFNDLRKFGFVKLVSTRELNHLIKDNFGPEPLDKKFTLDLFKSLLLKRQRSKIKPLLMDQKFIAGVGNLYADEILFYAGVRPDRAVRTLKSDEINKIYQEIKKVLKLAVEKRGSSAENYLDAYGREGNFIPLIKVYQRTGQACYLCGAKIKRIKFNNRSAHFCPKCQK